jgi:tellurite resistance protein
MPKRRWGDAVMRDEEFLGQRRRGLEAEFFRKHNAELLEGLRRQRERKDAIAALHAASGIPETDILEELLGLGVTAPALAAFAIAPLVAVAWADGTVEAAERSAVLEEAHEMGLEEGTPGFALLEGWLRQKPPASLFEAWGRFTRELCLRLEPAAHKHLKDTTVARAERIARAAGRVAGLGSGISPGEAATIERIREAFAT